MGGTIDFRYPLFVFILYTVAALMLSYIHTFEEETGYNIISKPQLRVHIDSIDKEAVRRSLYEVSKILAAVIPGSGRSFDIGTNIEDKFPRTVSLALNFYGPQTDYVEPKKSARCIVDLDNMMLSFYCGRRGHREPFELLEHSVKDEFSKQGIRLAKKPLVALRPS